MLRTLRYVEQDIYYNLEPCTVIKNCPFEVKNWKHIPHINKSPFESKRYFQMRKIPLYYRYSDNPNLFRAEPVSGDGRSSIRVQRFGARISNQVVRNHDLFLFKLLWGLRLIKPRESMGGQFI
jgi:hypothetical protein